MILNVLAMSLQWKLWELCANFFWRKHFAQTVDNFWTIFNTSKQTKLLQTVISHRQHCYRVKVFKLMIKLMNHSIRLRTFPKSFFTNFCHWNSRENLFPFHPFQYLFFHSITKRCQNMKQIDAQLFQFSIFRLDLQNI